MEISLSNMKNLDELLKLRKEWLDTYLDEPEFYEEFSKYNFVAYDAINDKISLQDSYESAKNYVDHGGQILVLDKKKIYTYKIKTDEEYYEYLTNELKNDSYNKMNYYGL